MDRDYAWRDSNNSEKPRGKPVVAEEQRAKQRILDQLAPDLQALVDRWSHTPEEIRRAVLALLGEARPSS
jgi:hypothetical protein